MVPLEVQGIEFILEFYLFDLGDLDLVLGFSWLTGLGETRANWGDLRLSWQIGKTWVTLYGDPDLSRGQVSLRSMEKVIKYTGVAYLLELASCLKVKVLSNRTQLLLLFNNSWISIKGYFKLPERFHQQETGDMLLPSKLDHLQSISDPIGTLSHKKMRLRNW